MEKKTKIALSVATVAVLIFLITAVAVRSTQSDKVEFTPPPFETNAQIGEVKNKSELYGAFSLPYEDGNKCSVGMEPMLRPTDNKVRINFSSDKDNTVWVRLVAVNDNNEVVFESGILKPGEYVEELELNKPASSGDKLKAKILTFDPDTYYSMGSANATLLLD